MSFAVPSVADINKAVLEEARRRATEILGKAEEEARKVVEEAEIRWREKYEAERSRILEEARRRAEVIVSEARSRARLAEARRRAEVIERVLEEAAREIASRSFDVRASLRNLLEEARRELGSVARILVSPNDVDVAREVAAELDPKIEVIADERVGGGLIAVSPGGVTLDNTYETRLRHFASRRLDEIYKVLWGASG
ncbi:MAG: V-type ATP synthase subunit E family protein [Desulfurococcaceae archaeon]